MRRRLLLALFYYSLAMFGQLVTVTETLQDSGGSSAVGRLLIQNPPFLSPQGSAVAITGATNASPIVVAQVGHGFSTDWTIYITGAAGNTAANGTWVITRVDDDHYSLNGSTGNGAWTSGGTAQRVILVAGDTRCYPTCTSNFTGTVSVQLYPTTNAIAIPGGSAAGFTYLVSYVMQTAARSTQRWNVPTSGPVSIQSVVTPGTVTPTATVALTQLGQDGASGTLTQDLRWTGSRWDNATLFDSTLGASHGTAAAGSATEAARDDHVHPVTPAAAAGFDWGSASLPWKDFYLAGTSGTPATMNFKLTGASTSGTRVVTFPNANSNTVIPDTGSANNFLTAISSGGVISKAQPAFSDLSGAATDGQIPNLNTLGTGLTASRCVETDGSGFLTVAAATCGTGSGYATIQDEGSDLTQRTKLNFAGSGVSCADDTTKTTCTISGTTATFITLPEFVAAKCQNATASLGLSTFTSNQPTAACVTGSNSTYGVAQFPDSDGDYQLQDRVWLPHDLTSTIDLGIKWRAAATSGDVVWQVQTACVADAETGDPAWNTASTVTDTAKGTTLQWNDASITTVTITGCAADEVMLFKFFRNRTHASDTISGTVDLISIRWKIRRSI